MNYTQMSHSELVEQQLELKKQYNEVLNAKLSLDMSRGKPEKLQLDLSKELLNVIS